MKKPASLLRREKLKRQKERVNAQISSSSDAFHGTPMPHQPKKYDEYSSGEDEKEWVKKKPKAIPETPLSPADFEEKLHLRDGASSSHSFIYDVPTLADLEPLRESFGQVLEKYNLIDNQNEEMDYETSEDEEEEEQPEALSNKKLRKMKQVPVAQLKQYAKHPEVVEWEDSTAPDPYFLVKLKCIRNTIPVPKHWSRKRRYLAGKRGFIKPPFELPDFLKGLGITEKRQEILAVDAKKTQKVKAREKVHPKLGRLPLDFQKLYDAFFKYQTRPPLTAYGDLYYEGKELQGKIREKRPGHLSEELRAALGMGPLTPPPWLFTMQRFGPPPSYPLFRIPGLNAPLPPGAQWGYHPGGWGKPPANLNDLGSAATGLDALITPDLRPRQSEPWGELEPEPEEEEVTELPDQSE